MGETQSVSFALKIITDAIVLDLKMLQQKAFFVLLGANELEQYNHSQYDPSVMEIRYGKDPTPKSQSIVLVVAPLLLKRGNSRGQNYDATVVIEKAEVDTETPKGKRSYLGKS